MKYISLLLLVFVSQSILAQKTDCIYNPENPALSPFLVEMDESSMILAPSLLTPYDLFESKESIFEMPKNNEIKLKDEYNYVDEEHELTIVRFQQYYKQIPAECGVIIANWQSCFLTNINGSINCDYNFGVKNLINPEDAIEAALNEVNAITYLWDVEEEENALKEEFGNDATNYPSPELMINCDEQLVFRVLVSSVEPYDSRTVDVDAKTGEIKKNDSNIRECSFHSSKSEDSCNHKNKENHLSKSHPKSTTSQPNIPNNLTENCLSFGSTLFNGTQLLTTSCNDDGSILYLEDEINKPYHEMRDMEETFWFNGIGEPLVLAGSSDATWPSEYVNVTSVHWSLAQTKGYFKNKLRYEYQGSKRLRIKANYGVGDCDFSLVGAFYTPAGPYGGTLNFGGINGYYGVLDVVGHEFTHFIISELNKLEYVNESGALNESFADIFGYMTDRNTNGADDWDLGERTGSAIRNLQYPSTVPLAPQCGGTTTQPDTYEGDHWHWDNEGSDGNHINSGVQNKWFSLLSEGGTHNEITVGAITQEKAAKIAYLNLLGQLGFNSTFQDSRDGSVHVAKILYGDCSYEHIQTQLAWEACKVDVLGNCITLEYEDDPEVYIYESSGVKIVQFCQNGRELPYYVKLTGSSIGNVTWTPLESGAIEGWEWETSGENNEMLIIKSINNSPFGLYHFKYTTTDGINGVVTFQVIECLDIHDPNDDPEFDCTQLKFKNQSVEIDNLDLNIKPNPANNFISLEIPGARDFYTYEIINTSGQLVISNKTINDGQISIDHLQTGIYTVRVVINNKVYISKFSKF